MSYTFSFCDALTAAVIKHMECGNRIQIQDLADHTYVTSSGLADRGFSILQAAAQKTGTRLPVIWAVDIGKVGKSPIKDKHLLFYTNNPGEILEKINKIPIKKQVDTPRATLVRMTVKRVKAILADVRKHNEWLERYNSSRGKKHPYKFVKIPIEGLITIEAIDKLVSNLTKASGSDVYNSNRTPSIKDYEYDLKRKKFF